MLLWSTCSLLARAGITCYSFAAVCITGDRIGLSGSRAQECAQPYLHSGHAPYYNEQHLKHLAAAIDKIGTVNLRPNPRKCVFGSDSVEYLGHTLSGDGVRPGQDKAKAMQSAQPPWSVKELRSFCGLANYFRLYIVQFAIKAAPLFGLTRQDSDWKGGELPPEAASAFLRLRDEIASRPVMAYPNATGQYHLFVDAALGNENNSGGLGLDVGSGGGPQETGCVRIKEIGQARTKLPGLSCGDAGCRCATAQRAQCADENMRKYEKT
jgi:hypothetical protein